MKIDKQLLLNEIDARDCMKIDDENERTLRWLAIKKTVLNNVVQPMQDDFVHDTKIAFKQVRGKKEKKIAKDFIKELKLAAPPDLLQTFED